MEQKQLGFGTTAEEMKAMYFNASEMKDVPYRLYQLNTRGERYYYVFDKDENPIFYPSVTTILHRVAPENKVLTDWKLKLGKEQADAYTAERAAYGTFIHGQLESMIIAQRYNLDALQDELVKYVEREKLPQGFAESHIEEAKADMVAFARWMWDYDVKPIAVEVALYSPTMEVAGMTDLVASIRSIPRSEEQKFIDKCKGDAEKEKKVRAMCGERINGIVDFKSGKKGFYESYEMQLEIYRRMWNETFPECEIDRIFNLAPKDWMGTAKKIPSYNFEEQTNKPSLAKVDIILQLYKACEADAERKIVNISGIIDLSKEDNNNVQIYTLSELVKNAPKDTEELEETENLDELF